MNPEEVQTLQEVFLAQQEEFELYKETTEKKIKAYVSDNNNLSNEIKELKEKINQIESENLKLKEKSENLENEKVISEAKIEENKVLEDNKENDYISEIQTLQSQLEETQKKKIKKK